MRYTETRIVYEDSCWFCPQYKWWGIWWNYETQRPGSSIALRAQFLNFEQAEQFIKECRKHNTYKGPK